MVSVMHDAAKAVVLLKHSQPVHYTVCHGYKTVACGYVFAASPKCSRLISGESTIMDARETA